MRLFIGRKGTGAFGRYATRGVTLLELMVALSVLAILAAIAFPSFTSVINSNRLTSAANQLAVDLQYARSEAMRRNGSVEVCASTDESTCNSDNWQAWIVRTTSPAAVLRVGQAKAPVQMIASAAMGAADDTIVFRPEGLARGADGLVQNVSVSACIETTLPAENARSVTLASGSRVSVAKLDGGGACNAIDDE